MENLTQKEPVWRENGKGFVESVTRLLERLLDYRNVGQVSRYRVIQTCISMIHHFYLEQYSGSILEMYKFVLIFHYLVKGPYLKMILVPYQSI